MDHNHLSNQPSAPSENPWSILESPDDHILSAEELKQISANFRAEQIAKAPEEVNFFASDIRDTEKAFQSQLERSASRGEPYIPSKEFERWEDIVADDWRLLQERASIGNMSSDAEAKAESPMFTAIDPAHTIEAQAGHFFDDRKDALLDAIRSTDTPTKDQDLEIIRKFPALVGAHLDYRYMSMSEAAEYGESYDRLRTAAHNDVIDGLNSLNDLAHKYHTRSFTPRDFWNSRNPNQTPSIGNRMSYDRHVVEEYCTYAFASDVARHERKRQREDLFY